MRAAGHVLFLRERPGPAPLPARAAPPAPGAFSVFQETSPGLGVGGGVVYLGGGEQVAELGLPHAKRSEGCPAGLGGLHLSDAGLLVGPQRPHGTQGPRNRILLLRPQATPPEFSIHGSPSAQNFLYV